MVKIAAGICTYSDSLGLARLLDSLSAGQVYSIVIHGPYPSYYNLDPDSLTATNAICKAYPNIRLIDLPEPLAEVERRQTYLDLANNYDFLLVLDSDEHISDKADWPLFRRNCEQLMVAGQHHYIYDIQSIAQHPSNSGPKPRLFREPSKIKYYKKHYWWLLPNGKVAAGGSDSCQTIDGITIMHDETLRSPERIQAKINYQNWLLQQENRYTISNQELSG
jgi:hypothetical protein